jgi:hypothetical protein
MTVKGLHAKRVLWHIGPTFDTTPEDRTPRGSVRPASGKVDLIMDLLADQKVPLSAQWTDEVGNPVGTPVDATAVYTVDDSSIIALTDNGDGTAVAAATGVLGVATVHGEFTAPGFAVPLTGDLQINVVAGMAERVAIVPGVSEEVTPDV